VLAARGLTPAVINGARALLETVGTIAPHDDIASIEQDQEQLAKSETALWAWYLEWSQIARIAVTQRALLKQMGFVVTHAKADNTADPGNGIEPDGTVAPAAPQSTVNAHS
jgi:hypothetical protein